MEVFSYADTPNISIHAPREGSDCSQTHRHREFLPISIHAPREGSDVGVLFRNREWEIFQSTLPVRGATNEKLRAELEQVFQSTLPVRGATRFGDAWEVTSVISIHAPREGSDRQAVHENL